MGKTAHDQREQDYFAMKHDNEHIKAQEKIYNGAHSLPLSDDVPSYAHSPPRCAIDFFNSTWGKRRKRRRYVRRGSSNRFKANSFWSGVKLDLKSFSIPLTAWLNAKFDFVSCWYPSRTPRYQ